MKILSRRVLGGLTDWLIMMGPDDNGIIFWRPDFKSWENTTAQYRPSFLTSGWSADEPKNFIEYIFK
jgi:hypothetical protein